MTKEPVPASVPLVLLVSVLAISAAAVLFRGIDDAGPLAASFWRTAIVAVALSPAIRRVSRADVLRIALAGVCLAAHFVTWFASLQHTTVLRSTVLVTLAPAWAGVVEWLWLGQSPRRIFWAGLAIALVGVPFLSSAGGSSAWTGDGLATVGGVLGALYMLIGRDVRQRVGIGAYAGLVCAAAAVVLFLVAVVTATPLWGFSWTSWGLIVALALGPQLFGHNGLNYALRWLPASTVSAVVLLEPVGAALLAGVFLAEWPGPAAIVGSVLVQCTTVGRRKS